VLVSGEIEEIEAGSLDEAIAMDRGEKSEIRGVGRRIEDFEGRNEGRHVQMIESVGGNVMTRWA